MIELNLPGMLINIWYRPLIYFSFNVRSFQSWLRIDKQFKFSLGYFQISARERFYKVWNEGSKQILDDDDCPF